MSKNNAGASVPPTSTPVPVWHALTVDATLAKLKTGPIGLSADEARRRLEEYGPNELRAARRVSPWSLLLDQFKNVLIVILLVATGLSAFLGEGVETIIIGVIVLFAVGLGFIQEFRAEKAIDALRKMAAPTATVLCATVKNLRCLRSIWFPATSYCCRRAPVYRPTYGSSNRSTFRLKKPR
jgi:P-type Ca2+ transporter type 2C